MSSLGRHRYGHSYVARTVSGGRPDRRCRGVRGVLGTNIKMDYIGRAAQIELRGRIARGTQGHRFKAKAELASEWTGSTRAQAERAGRARGRASAQASGTGSHAR